jgi:hypothetical protein
MDSFRLSRAPWAWAAAARAVVAGAVIGALTLGTGDAAAASVAYFAVACSSSFSVTGSPLARVRTVSGQAVGAMAGLALAGVSPHAPVWLVAAAVVAGFVSGGAQRLARPEVTAGALMFLVALAFGSFAPIGIGWPSQVLWYAIGAAVVAALAVVPIGRPIPSPALRSDGRVLPAGVALAVAFGVATLLAATVDQGRHSYWLPLTTAVVMRVEYGPLTSRVPARLAGTVVGAVIAAAVVGLVMWTGLGHREAAGHTDAADAVVACVAVLGMACAALTAPRLYALAVVGITVSALLAGEIGVDDPITPLVRVGDTVLGSLVAVVVTAAVALLSRSGVGRTSPG